MSLKDKLIRRRKAIWKRINDLRERQKKNAAERRRRQQLLTQKRSRRKAARGRKVYWERKYQNLPRGVDELEAHRVKTRMLDAREEWRTLNREIDDLLGKILNQRDIWQERSEIIRRLIHVRLPHIARRIKKAEAEAKANDLNPLGSRIVTFDGKPCAEWLAYRMKVARAAGWNGYLNSGWRSPEYSESLCYNMCGAPSCPGRCAGRASNHAKNVYPYGAIDVGDYYTFGALMRSLDGRIPGVHIYNALGAADPVHFSSSGR